MKKKIVTFKADAAFAEVLDAIPNKSTFNYTSPLCLGTGIFAPEQKRHWDIFRRGEVEINPAQKKVC